MTDAAELPLTIEGPSGAGHHSLEYLNYTIDVSDVDEITLKKDHNVIISTENE
jgi:4-diphosphocytidyl-2C-methyl-D-erythritol kinase